MSNQYRFDMTIASGAAVSDGVSIEKHPVDRLAVQVPAAWTAADIGFDVSQDDSTYIPLKGATGSRLKITGVATGAAGVYIAPAETFLVDGYRYVRLASLDTGDESAENQGAARSLVLVLLDG